MKFYKPQFGRFLIIGAINSAITYFIYLGLLWVFHYLVAYTISFLFGIISAYLLNARFVFFQPWRLSKALQFPVVYIVQYGFGAALLSFMVDLFRFSPAYASLLVVILTLPITFLISQLIISGRSAKSVLKDKSI
jgi:putative flippase GtrA